VDQKTVLKFNLKYPVLLVHGAGARDKIFNINYWGRIPKKMAQCGIEVYHGKTDAWDTIEYNALILKKRLEEIIKESGVEKVNIIAHSRGGLEARYLISSLGQFAKTASLTTISTPHRGVKAMNIALDLPMPLYKITAFFVNIWYKIFGDNKPDFYASSRQLAERTCVEFNSANKDNPLVFYQIFAAKMKHFFSDPFFIIMNPFLRLTDGENDGLCPVESAKWGNFKGIITTQGVFGISHLGIIDAYRIKYKGVDIPGFYLSILEDLAAKGY
jgi:triacylglycerol lipase